MRRGSRRPLRTTGLGLVVVLGGGCELPPREAAPVALAKPPVVHVEAPQTPRPTPTAVARPALRSPEALSSAERRRFDDAVSEGRRRHGERDYEGAMISYGVALEVVPFHPRTLSEKGWAALFAGKLDDAQAALDEALAGAGDDETLRASILYNLGRVAEQKDDPRAAIDAYQRSLRLRAHPTVYRHLTRLEGGTRYVFGPEVRRLQGPYPRLADFCQEERRLSRAERGREEPEAFACLPDAARGLGGEAVTAPSSRRLPEPYRGLRFVETRPSPYAVHFHGAIQTDEGWFVLTDLAVLGRSFGSNRERPTQLAARAEDLLPGGSPEVVLEAETRWSEAEGGVELESEVHRVEYLCGVGPSGRPSCTGALPRELKARRRGGRDSGWAVRRRVVLPSVVVLEGDAHAMGKAAAGVLGEHRVAFL